MVVVMMVGYDDGDNNGDDGSGDDDGDNNGDDGSGDDGGLL